MTVESSPSSLHLYDTLSGQKQPLQTLEPGRCRVYCCGPTVYDMSHIGHARAALVPDILVRVLKAEGLEVTYARNITDIDDKIIARAVQAQSTPEAIATKFTEEYFHDLDALAILRPDIAPTVTGHIPQIIAMVEGLIAKELAYTVEGDVYYRVDRFAGYGKLSKRNLEDMRAGARVDVDTRKENPLDFALWKAAKPGEPAWESPWGQGRPGWHIECSAMSVEHLGVTFDIHTGGRDLIFPHHENEIAQAQGVHGEHSFARYWVHNGFVNFAGEKMSKSLGNFFTVREVTALYHPEVVRFFLLGVHYRSGINFDVEVRCPSCGQAMSAEAQKATTCQDCGHVTTAEVLKGQVVFPGLEEADDRVAYVYTTIARARETLERLPEIAEEAGVSIDPAIGELGTRVREAMLDDLNTSAALAALSPALTEVNRLIDTVRGKKAKRPSFRAHLRTFVTAVAKASDMLGVFHREPAGYLQVRRDLKSQRIGLDIAKVEALVGERSAARAAKDWAQADALREQLTGMGVSVQDSGDASTWTL